MSYEPPYLEIFLTRLAFLFYGKRVYKTYADRLPLRGDEAVLDFGSGLGTVAHYIALRLSQGRLTCVDISAKWLSACRKTLQRYPDVLFHRGEVYALPLSRESFDLIYCHFVLHDIPDNELERVLPALASLLKAGGILAFREPLKEREKLSLIQRQAERGGLSRRDSRVTDAPLMGNTLECIYIK